MRLKGEVGRSSRRWSYTISSVGWRQNLILDAHDFSSRHKMQPGTLWNKSPWKKYWASDILTYRPLLALYLIRWLIKSHRHQHVELLAGHAESLMTAGSGTYIKWVWRAVATAQRRRRPVAWKLTEEGVVWGCWIIMRKGGGGEAWAFDTVWVIHTDLLIICWLTCANRPSLVHHQAEFLHLGPKGF